MKVLFLFLLWSPLGSDTPKKAAAAARASGDGEEWQNDGEEVAGGGGAGMGLVAADELAICMKVKKLSWLYMCYKVGFWTLQGDSGGRTPMLGLLYFCHFTTCRVLLGQMEIWQNQLGSWVR